LQYSINIDGERKLYTEEELVSEMIDTERNQRRRRSFLHHCIWPELCFWWKCEEETRTREFI